MPRRTFTCKAPKGSEHRIGQCSEVGFETSFYQDSPGLRLHPLSRANSWFNTMLSHSAKTPNAAVCLLVPMDMVAKPEITWLLGEKHLGKACIAGSLKKKLKTRQVESVEDPSWTSPPNPKSQKALQQSVCQGAYSTTKSSVKERERVRRPAIRPFTLAQCRVGPCKTLPNLSPWAGLENCMTWKNKVHHNLHSSNIPEVKLRMWFEFSGIILRSCEPYGNLQRYMHTIDPPPKRCSFHCFYKMLCIEAAIKCQQDDPSRVLSCFCWINIHMECAKCIKLAKQTCM